MEQSWILRDTVAFLMRFDEFFNHTINYSLPLCPQVLPALNSGATSIVLGPFLPLETNCIKQSSFQSLSGYFSKFYGARVITETRQELAWQPGDCLSLSLLICAAFRRTRRRIFAGVGHYGWSTVLHEVFMWKIKCALHSSVAGTGNKGLGLVFKLLRRSPSCEMNVAGEKLPLNAIIPQ